MKTATDATASEFRTLIASKKDGVFLGGETELQEVLGASRATLRQAARLLELEGLLAVRRGSRGGYYARRPDMQSIETAVVNHLESLDVHGDELSTAASVIWAEVLQRAARASDGPLKAVCRRLGKTLDEIPEDATHDDLLEVEETFRSEICASLRSPYLQFLFRVTVSFGHRRAGRKESAGRSQSSSALNPLQVAAWRAIKRLECESVLRGDVDLAALATSRSRSFWRSILDDDH